LAQSLLRKASCQSIGISAAAAASNENGAAALPAPETVRHFVSGDVWYVNWSGGIGRKPHENHLMKILQTGRIDAEVRSDLWN
jgi:hypothetical protein